MKHVFSIVDTLAGRHIFLIGATGFLGKVVLSTLCKTVPEIGSVTCLVRPGRNGQTAHERFRAECWDSPVCAPLRTALGATAERFYAEKIAVCEGDITHPDLGLDAAATRIVRERSPLVINLSGLVNFNPPLAAALATNVTGVAHVARFAARCPDAALLHISTCYVAGARSGTFAEEPLRFDHRKEIATLEAVLHRTHGARATEIGLARARVLGWPNIYTFTKALGEQVVAATANCRFTIVRPAIIESAMTYPEPGWNEGINTSAPLAFLGLLGQARYPCGDGVILDVIPVDQVANALCIIAAASLRGVARPLYQLGSSDTNPLLMREAIELTGLFKRRYLTTEQSKTLAEGLGMPNWLRYLMAQWEAVPVSAAHFHRFSAPRIRRAIDRVLPSLTTVAKEGIFVARTIARPLADAGKALRALAARAEEIFVQYLPFIHDHVYIFRCDRMRALYRQLPTAERTALPWAPETIRWRDYWIDIHLAGLARHVFPMMTAKLCGKAGRPFLPHLSFLVPMPIPEGLKVRDIRFPAMVRKAGKQGLGTVQELLYRHVFTTTVTGRGHIPANRNVLVVANHSSHLDMGLVKYALGAYGRCLRALAAKDYFFRDGLRRIYFGNFTNLIPIDRSADLRESLKPALTALVKGEMLLMFPEGTRTLTGAMGRFKRGVGYVALTAGVDVLPVALGGTFTAIPKGRLLIPRHRRIGARIGPAIPNAELQQAVAGLAPDEAYRHAAGIIEEAVRRLATGKNQAAQPALPVLGAGRGATGKAQPINSIRPNRNHLGRTGPHII